jgi:hypothetical protein
LPRNTNEETYKESLAPAEALKRDVERETVTNDRNADGLVPCVYNWTGSPNHVFVVDSVGRETENPRASREAAVNEEGRPDWALERAQGDLRRV